MNGFQISQISHRSSYSNIKKLYNKMQSTVRRSSDRFPSRLFRLAGSDFAAKRVQKTQTNLSRTAFLVRANAPTPMNNTSPNGSLSSQKQGADLYNLPRSEQARADEWRTVYDFPQWIKHRRPTRLYDRLLQIPRSQILLNILPSVGYCTGLAGTVRAYNLFRFPMRKPCLTPQKLFLDQDSLRSTCSSWTRRFCLPTSPTPSPMLLVRLL